MIVRTGERKQKKRDVQGKRRKDHKKLRVKLEKPKQQTEREGM